MTDLTFSRLLTLFSRLLFGLATLLLAGYLALYVIYAINLMRFPFDYDQGEGFELVDTVMFSRGEWPYRNNEVYPFYASNYPPLFHVILVPFVWIFGTAYWYGRLAGFVGTLITAAAITYAVYREGRHRQIAVLSGLAFLSSNYIYHVGPLFRQHMTMVMFETLAVVVLAHVTEIPDRRQRRRVMLGGLALLLAAGYTKQLALATVIAVFGFLFVRNPRRSIAWGVIFAGAAGGIFAWINVSTGGAWWDNIIAANVNEFIAGQFTALFKHWFRVHSVLAIMAGLVVIYELYFSRLSLYSVWAVLALINSTLSGKWGAGDSYFATAIAAMCLLSGIFAARTLRGAWDFPAEHPLVQRTAPLFRLGTAHRVRLLVAASLIVPALYLFYGVRVFHLPTEGAFFGWLADRLGVESSHGTRYAFHDSAGWVPGYATIGHLTTQADVDNGWRIVDILRASDRPAMSEEAGFSLRAGKDVVTNPTQLKNLYENGMFDPANLVAAIQAHMFGVVVFRAQFYPPPVLAAVYEAYYPAEVIPMNGFNYEIWWPGPPQTERTALVENLAQAAPARSVEQVISLPLDSAALWLAHALKQHNWQADPADPTLAGGDPSCRVGIYRQGERTLRADLCPRDANSASLVLGEP